MAKSGRGFLLVCIRLAAAACFGLMLLAGPVLAAGSAPDAPRLQETYGRLPLHFIENRGQMDARVKVYAQGQGYALFFTAEGIILAGRIPAETGGSPKAALVKITPRGSSLNAPQPEEPLPGKVNYLVGNDPHKWRTRVPTYAAVRYREVFPGIDLKCYGAGSRLEYDLIVRPGADPSGVKFQVEGAAALKITPEGDLAMSLPGGPVVIQKKPVIYQEIHGRQVAREGGFKISRRDRSCYGFELAAYDPARPLIIDPAIRYSTFLGGGQDDQGAAIAVDATGNAYITGQTFSLAFPVTRSRPFIIFPEAFVTKINAAGNGLVFSTFLGGNGNEAGTGIAVDGTGVYVTGWTDSLDFPVRNAFQPTKDLAVDAFVAKLNPSGSALIYSSYLGGNGDDRTAGLALIAGQAIVTGTTSSIDFPVRAALQPINLGNTAAFVTRLTAAGSGLVFSTYLGGSKEDIGTAVAVDGGGNTYVTGGTTSLNFPILNPFQGNNLGSQDAFVSKLSPTGRLLYSTFLGGSSMDVARAIAVDGLGQAYVTGETASQNFPLRNPFQGARWGTRDAFVTRLTAAGNNLSYSTYLGGSNTDQGLGIRVDGAGQATVVGVTASFDFPVRNAVQPAYRGGASDAFVTRFTPTGRALVYSTFLGGQKIEQAKAVALLAPLLTTAFVTGFTNSFNFPIRSAFQPSLRGANDVFVTRINP